MIGCRMSFYKDVLGVPFPAAGGAVDMRAARDLNRAVEAAKLRFSRASGISDWRLRADHVGVEGVHDA